MIIKKIFKNQSNGAKLISIPRNCDLQEGDYVQLVKVSDIQTKNPNQINNTNQTYETTNNI